MRAIVVGAGPAGATAALTLVRSGVAVSLIEKAAWPRAKTCGDGISPLAIRELTRLGVGFEHGLHLDSAVIGTPSGTIFRGHWPEATPWGTIVTRIQFDAALVDAAIGAGVDFRPKTSVHDVVSHEDAATVTTRTADGTTQNEHVDVVIVADGATGVLAARLGFPAHRSRVVALRAYAASRKPLAAEYGLYYDRYVAPGYGWIFPLSPERANIGICVDERTLRREGGNIRELLRRWLRENPTTRDLFGPNPQLDELQGGIIPTGRGRRVLGRVFLAGDAAGVADPFTAEGIYESIHCGELAAQAIVEASDVAAAGMRYERLLHELDCNAGVARALRATFAIAIEPYARYAARRQRFADRLATTVFFLKPAWHRLMWRMHFG